MSGLMRKNLRECFGSLLDDARVTEIVLNDDGAVWVERAGDPAMIGAGITLAPEAAQRLGQDLAGGHPISQQKPLAGYEFEIDGALWRTQVVAPPAVQDGYSAALRRTVSDSFPLDALTKGASLRDLVSGENPMDRAVMEAYRSDDVEAFLRAAVRAKWNILFSGGTSSGKTTWLRACMGAIAPQERIITIEDVFELRPSQPNRLCLRTSKAASSGDLLKASLRLRPDRIMMGELRGAEAYEFLSAINSGHPGGLSTLHASSPDAAMARLAFMVMEANRGMTFKSITAYCRSMIDVVVQLAKVDGRRGPTQVRVFRDGCDE